MEKEEISYDNAPFNFALATLMRIDKILMSLADNEKKIGLCPNQIDRIPEGLALATKYRLVWQLFINTSPLLNKEAREEILKCLKKGETISKDSKGNIVTDCETDEPITYVYSDSVDIRLNEIIILIQQKLQEGGNYFMPSKDDPRFALLGGR